MVSDSVTRTEVYQQLIRAKNQTAVSGSSNRLSDALYRDLKQAVSRSPAHDGEEEDEDDVDDGGEEEQVPEATPPLVPGTASSSESSSRRRRRRRSPRVTGRRRLVVAVASISGQLARDLLSLDSQPTDTSPPPPASSSEALTDPDSLADHPLDSSSPPPPLHRSYEHPLNSGLTHSLTHRQPQQDSHLKQKSKQQPVPHNSLQQLEQFRKESNYEGVVILGIRNSDPDQVVRDIVLYFPDPHLMQKVRLSLMRPLSSNAFVFFKTVIQMSAKLESPSSRLQLTLNPSSSPSSSIRCYSQANITASRKVILPLVSQVLDQEVSDRDAQELNRRPSDDETSHETEDKDTTEDAGNDFARCYARE